MSSGVPPNPARSRRCAARSAFHAVAGIGDRSSTQAWDDVGEGAAASGPVMIVTIAAPTTTQMTMRSRRNMTPPVVQADGSRGDGYRDDLEAFCGLNATAAVIETPTLCEDQLKLALWM